MPDDNDEAAKDLAALQAVVKRLKLTGKDAAEYIHDHMTHFGYKSRRSYYRDSKDDKSVGGWWKKQDGGGSDDDE